MSKINKHDRDQVADRQPRSFYRPHVRVQFGNELVNPHTGEVSYPPSMTKQSHKDECDINNIIKQYKVTGMVTHISANARQGAYQDLPAPIEFQEALNIVAQAEQAFATLPSKVRDRFQNDPEAFLAFTSDPRNAKEMADLGLTNPVAPLTMANASLAEVREAFNGGGAGGGTPPADASPKAPKGASGAS